MDVIVGAQGKKCRLVAMRTAPEVTAAWRAQLRKKARDCGKNPCPKCLLRDGWHLMLTNLSREQADVSQLAAIYRARSRGGNPLPRLEASAQPWQSPQSQELKQWLEANIDHWGDRNRTSRPPRRLASGRPLPPAQCQAPAPALHVHPGGLQPVLRMAVAASQAPTLHHHRLPRRHGRRSRPRRHRPGHQRQTPPPQAKPDMILSCIAAGAA